MKKLLLLLILPLLSFGQDAFQESGDTIWSYWYGDNYVQERVVIKDEFISLKIFSNNKLWLERLPIKNKTYEFDVEYGVYVGDFFQITYYENGLVSASGTMFVNTMTDNLKEGLWQYWNELSNLVEEVMYEGGWAWENVHYKWDKNRKLISKNCFDEEGEYIDCELLKWKSN